MTTSGGWLSGASFWVDGVESPPPTASGGGGGGEHGGGAVSAGAAAGGAWAGLGGGKQGFRLSREEAEQMLAKARRVRDRSAQQRLKAKDLIMIQPPAQDRASVRFNDAATTGGITALFGGGAFNRGAEAMQKRYEYFDELTMRLEKALGIYQEADESAAGKAGRAGAAEGSDDPNKGRFE